MNEDELEELVNSDPYIEQFQGYEYVPHNIWNKIPKGACIKYINRDQEVFFAGFLKHSVNHIRPECRKYVLQNNDVEVEFRPFFYYIFYKMPDMTIKSLSYIKNKNTNKNTNIRKRTKKNKTDLFKKLLLEL